jgi:hypothetical protein
VAMSPSIFTHSWSLVYFKFAGMLIFILEFRF